MASDYYVLGKKHGRKRPTDVHHSDQCVSIDAHTPIPTPC